MRTHRCHRVTTTAASTSNETKGAAPAPKELRGAVLDVLKELLADRRDDEVLALVAKLVARNGELEKLLAKLRESKNRGEQVSPDQLRIPVGPGSRSARTRATVPIHPGVIGAQRRAPLPRLPPRSPFRSTRARSERSDGSSAPRSERSDELARRSDGTLG
jgi:hypothetical protein